MPIRIDRQRTSKKRLIMHWDFPVFRKADLSEGDASETVAALPDRALDRGAAFAYVAGDDPRPLLVLRECEYCVGSEVALLSRTQENDRTLLMAQWFHCVKLPNDVLRDDHPFRKLFDEKNPAHLVLANADGSDPLPLSGAQSQKDLWQRMGAVLAGAYTKDPERAAKAQYRLLAQLDHLDMREDELKSQLDLRIEKDGPASPKVRKLRNELEKIRTERAKALADEEKIVDLGVLEKAPEDEAAGIGSK